MASSMADEIKQHARSSYLCPARQAGACPVSIRAGDLHSVLNLQANLPGVTSALGSNSFCDESGIRRLSIEGPSSGANAIFTYCWCEQHQVVIQKVINT